MTNVIFRSPVAYLTVKVTEVTKITKNYISWTTQIISGTVIKVDLRCFKIDITKLIIIIIIIVELI